jgi:predicted secreted acid phosphatase
MIKNCPLAYNKRLLKDPVFREFYQQNLCKAIYIFPKFTRNYSKNYKLVQHSFKKTSKKKKTIVFDIDETLVYAT